MYALRNVLAKSAAGSSLRAAALAANRAAVPTSLWANNARFGSSLAKDEVSTRIVELLKGFDKCDPSKVCATSHFVNDLGLDSLDTVEVVLAIENEFSIEIPDKDADSILSVPQAIAYITKREDAY